MSAPLNALRDFVGPPVVRPEPGSRLEQLAAQYDLARAESAKAAEALAAIVAGIKLELSTAAPPGANSVDLVSDHLVTPLRLVAVESWRVDATKLKREDPETYVRYARKSTTWRLQAVSD